MHRQLTGKQKEKAAEMFGSLKIITEIHKEKERWEHIKSIGREGSNKMHTGNSKQD